MLHQPQFVVANAADRRVGSSLLEIPPSNHSLSFLMEAHDGLPSAVAECAGFKGLCASALSIACSPGYRDANEAPRCQLVTVVERIADSTELPVGDDIGFEHFDNALLARKVINRARSIRNRVAPSWARIGLRKTQPIDSEVPSDADEFQASSAIHFWLPEPAGFAALSEGALV